MPYNRKNATSSSDSFIQEREKGVLRERYQLRERLMSEHSFDGFTDREILTTILSYSHGPVNAEGLAECLLDSFGSLKAVLEARPEQLMAVKGISWTAVSLITMTLPLTRVWIRSAEEKIMEIPNTTAAMKYCRSLLVGERVEKFYVIALNSRHRILGKRLISIGSLTGVNAYPRIVVETALNYNAKFVLLCHNHPGGTNFPSVEDIIATEEIREVLTKLDIYVLDHIIVYGNQTYSMLENGDINIESKKSVSSLANQKKVLKPGTRRKKTAECKEKGPEGNLIPYERKAFGIAVSKMRVQRGMTQEQLSGLAGIARSHLADLESGKKVVRLDTLWRIAEALGVQADALVRVTEAECIGNLKQKE